VLEVGMIVGGQ